MNVALTEKAVATAVEQCRSLPDISTTDQGSQSTSPEWTGKLKRLVIEVRNASDFVWCHFYHRSSAFPCSLFNLFFPSFSASGGFKPNALSGSIHASKYTCSHCPDEGELPPIL